MGLMVPIGYEGTADQAKLTGGLAQFLDPRMYVSPPVCLGSQLFSGR
jgi:hypothetical protein